MNEIDQSKEYIKSEAGLLFEKYMGAAMRIIQDPEKIPPDFVIREDYLQRWWLAKIEKQHNHQRLGELKDHTFKSEHHNCYLHRVTGSDDDRAMHDHPWVNASFIISGSYIEHTPVGEYIRSPGEM
jgi:hypothetical protein